MVGTGFKKVTKAGHREAPAAEVNADMAIENMRSYLRSRKIKGYNKFQMPIMSQYSDSTITHQQHMVRYILKKHAGGKLEFTTEWVDRVRDKMEMANVKTGSIRTYMLVLENLFSANDHPLNIAKPKEMDTTDTRVFHTEDDILKMIRATVKVTKTGTVEHARDYAMLYTLWGSAARANELLNLRVSDFKMESGHGFVEIQGTKGYKTRKVPLPDPATNAVKKWLAYRDECGINKDDFPYMFISSAGNGDRLVYGTLYDIVYTYGKKVGIDTHPHLWRHSRCSHLLNVENVPVPVVQKLMGHKRIQTTMGYCHTSFDDMARYIW